MSRDVLYVATSSSTWAQDMKFKRRSILLSGKKMLLWVMICRRRPLVCGKSTLVTLLRQHLVYPVVKSLTSKDCSVLQVFFH